ncbi:hypothetical protein [Cellvibrio sp. UBA7661]|uniref:hypothetical protein n=1 Tax=Cellvibrio sp. UBA7661 TaxID=1946311 RepID=UPI002F35372B
MTQENYWLISLGISGLALAMSIATFFYSHFRSKKTDEQKLYEKKTDVLISINELHDLASELTLIILQKVSLFQEYSALRENEIKEHVRVRANLAFLRSELEFLNDQRRKLQELSPSDIESWESMKATYKSWSNNISSTISKEQSALNELKSKVIKNG